MPYFRYQALNAAQQSVAGEIEADSVTQAVERLEATGLTLQSIAYAERGRSAGNPAVIHAVVTKPDDNQAELRSHLATLIERARPLVPALRAYAAELPARKRRHQLTSL